MHLDVLTLMTIGSFVTTISGLLLLGAWTQIRSAGALLWWSAASLVYAIGIGLLAVGITGTSPVLPAIGGGVSSISPALIWAGARSFNGRRQIWPLLVAGIVLWALSGVVPPAQGSEHPAVLPTAVGLGAWIVYLGAAGLELLRNRGERLAARYPLVAFMGLHAIVFLAGVFDTLTGAMPDRFDLPAFSSLFSFIHFETVIYAISTSVFMVVLCKERSERSHIIAAQRDSLTGIANRGALLDSGERLLARCRADGKSLSLIIFDLDHFKRVNDTFGHAAGDEVLRAFADATQSILRPNDVFGRYGGEEFLVILPGATIEAAYVIAERIRAAFAAVTTAAGEASVKCTVSAGIASANSIEMTLDEVIRAADTCLYRAKELGRNRVERPARAIDAQSKASVIRVA
ncbi:MAG TPA: GGDEF domain-containing protein [Bauldia sp.]|nr:GGDEF domain-containing protein [Bauldia sp.]